MTRHWFTALMLAISSLAMGGAGHAAELIGSYVDYQVDVQNLPAGTTADGTWQIGMAPLCKQWKINQIVNLNVRAGKNAVSIVLVQQGDESADGLTGNYSMQMSANGQQVQINQSVTFPAKGQPGKMNIAVGPNTTATDIPPDVKLVAAGTQYMLDQLSAGKTDFSVKLVEPSSPNGVVEARVEVLPNSPFSDKKLPADTSGALKGKSWFIKMTVTSSGQAQELKMQLHESGVTSRILANISGVQMEMTARSITIFPKPNC